MHYLIRRSSAVIWIACLFVVSLLSSPVSAFAAEQGSLHGTVSDPLGALVAVTAGLLACLAVFHPNRAAVGVVMLMVFTVGLEGDRVRSLLVGALMAPVVTIAVLLTASVKDTGGMQAGRSAALQSAEQQANRIDAFIFAGAPSLACHKVILARITRISKNLRSR